MLIDELKKRMTQAMRERDDVARSVLSVALGEVQLAEVRAGRSLGDDEVMAILRKLVKSNDETLGLSGEDGRAATLRRENEVLQSLLPAKLSVAELVKALESQRDALRGAKNEGHATGLAMKHLKAAGASFDGADVTAAVKVLRH